MVLCLARYVPNWWARRLQLLLSLVYGPRLGLLTSHCLLFKCNNCRVRKVRSLPAYARFSFILLSWLLWSRPIR